MKTALRVVGVLILFPLWGSYVVAQENVIGKGTVGSIPLWVGHYWIDNSVITQGKDDAINISSRAMNGLTGTTDNASNGSTALTGNNTASSGVTFGVQGFSASPNGIGVGGTGEQNGVVGTVNGDSLGASGVFGLATATSGITFGVGGASVSSEGIGVFGNSPNVGVEGESQTCNASAVCTPTTGIAGAFITASGGTILQGFISSGGSSPWTSVFRVDSAGMGFFDGGTQTGGADFAESVAVSKGLHPYEPGDLLVLDATADRQLKLSSEPYSTLVAGIYSTKPGVLATTHKLDTPATDGEVPLAIVGIVPCKVSAENGPIQRGDLLVASSTAGYAMKGTDRSRMLGAVVGKAMEPLTSGTGTIQVLVTLQ